MKITIYQKDQGAHKTTWKEFAKYDENDHFHVNSDEGLIRIRKTTFTNYTNEDGSITKIPNSVTIFCGGGENFYFTKE